MISLQIQPNLSINESGLNESFLYVHPSTLTSLGVSNGSFVLASGFILKLFSHEAVAKDKAVFHSTIFKYYESSDITVTPLQLNVEAAKEVHLYPEKFRSFMASSDFQQHVSKIMRHFYVREGLVLNINYLGYRCYFTIRSIIPNVVSEKKILCTPKSYSESMEDLWLGDIKTSTPISSRKESARSFRVGNKAKCLDGTFYFLHSLSKVVVKKNKPKIHISFKDVTAMDEVVKFIKSSIYSISQSNFDVLNVFPKGIILIGPSGSGKSMISKALKSSECNIPVFSIGCQDMKSSVSVLENIYKEAVLCSASVVFFDDLDLIFKQDDRRVVDKQFLRDIRFLIFKFLNYAPNVLLIATVKNINLIPSFLRKNGFFDKELSTNVSSLGRKQIFLKMLKEYKCVLSESEIDQIIEDTNGFTGGQLQHLCNKARELCLQDLQSQNFHLTFNHLKQSLKQIKPTVPFNFEIPNVRWSDIGGMQHVKDVLTEMINWPLRLSSQFKRFRIPPSKGILMYGPPGCCKTMIAKALVTEGNFNFIPVKTSELFNKYVGESEKTVSDLFKRARAPCVLFFDEIDSLISTRNSTGGSSNVTERILTQLLTEIDGIEPLTGVCILAATNRPDIIDPSFLRPGRFDHLIYVPLPDADTRCEIFNVKLGKMPTSEDVNATYLVNATEGYSGAEITEICEVAAKFALREDAASVSMEHFYKALKEVLPKTSVEMKQLFENYEKRTSHN